MEGKFFRIQSKLTGFALEIQNGTIKPGTPVCLRQPSNSESQLWYQDAINSAIRCKIDNNFVLEVQRDNLVINQFHPEEFWQKWLVSGEHIRQARDSSKVLEVKAACRHQGATVSYTQFDGQQKQQWTIQHMQPKLFLIRSMLNGLVLDIAGCNRDQGTEVCMYSENVPKSANQLWWEDKYGVIRSNLNSFALDGQESTVRMRPQDPAIPSRQWVRNGIKISNKADPSRVLDIKGNSRSRGAKICAYGYKASDNQHWIFEYIN